MAYIQFYYPKRLSFCPLDYETPGLGGSEASLVLVAKALAERGHKVEVYNACWQPNIYNGVAWKGAWEIDNAPNPDVFVAVRFKSAIIDSVFVTRILYHKRTEKSVDFLQTFP